MKSNTLKTICKCIFAEAVAISAISFTACSKNETVTEQKEYKNISLSWWGTDARAQYTLDAVKNFEDLHPDIKVTTKYGDWSGYEQRMDIEVASDTEADVMQINYAWINKYSSQKKTFYDLEKLGDYVDLSQFDEDDLNYGRKNNELLAIPIALNTYTAVYNKTVYDKYNLKIPKTVEDLKNAAKIMSKDGVYPFSCVGKAAWFLAVSIQEERTGKKLYDDNYNVKFSDEDFADVIQIAADLINDKIIPPLGDFNKEKLTDGTYAGNMMWITDTAASLSGAIENGYKFTVGDYPVEKKGSDLSWYVKPATLYAISANTQYPEESAMLLDFLLNSREMSLNQKLEKGVPISKAARGFLEDNNLLEGIQYESFEKLQDNSDKVTKMNPYIESDDILTTFKDCVNRVLYNNESANISSKNLKNSVIKAAKVDG